jgi:site-specific recombinase XerD
VEKVVRPWAAKIISANDCTRQPTLTPEVTNFLRASLSDNSRRAYRSDLNHFLAWGGTIPATPEMVAVYLADHAEQHTTATLSRRLVSIGKAHSAQTLPSPTTTELVRATLRGIRHIHGSAQRQVAPAVKEDVLAMVAGLSGIKGLRDKALLLIGFAGAFRRSELVSLTVADIGQAKQGLVIQLLRSKTDQEGRGRKVAIPYARGVVCPVMALQEWLDVAKLTKGPIFRAVNRRGLISDAAITPQTVAMVVKKRAQAVGLDPAKYAGHSLRSGLVTSAAQLGVSSWKIRQQTGHKSEAMLARYIRDANIFVDNAAGAVL